MDELTAAMDREIAALTPLGDPVHRVLVKFGALGRGYIAFAREQPGLFRTVFSPDGPVLSDDVEQVASSPYRLLVDALDELVDVGYLRPERRPGAELAAWAIVHGLSAIFDGPLRDATDELRDEAIVRSLLLIAHGYAANGLSPEEEKLLANELLRKAPSGVPVQAAGGG